MNDLKEHFGTILWIVGTLLAITGVLIGVIWNDLKNRIEDGRKKTEEMSKVFPEWLKKQEEKGGTVTRNNHFEWCNDYQEKCIAYKSYRTLIEWRDAMLDKGGVLTKDGYLLMQEHIANNVMTRIEECFKHHREWVGGELKFIQTTMDGKIFKEIVSLRKEIMEESTVLRKEIKDEIIRGKI